MGMATLLRVLLVVALTLPTLARARVDASAQTPEPALSYEGAHAKLDRLMAGVEELRAQIDRSRFDVEELSFRLGFEAEPILGFVREQIAFEQYPGLLRGARGTLIGRAGNALDQAVLLATLLLHAGYEARLARGQLSPEQARVLIDQMAAPRRPEPPAADPAAIREILTAMGREAGVPEEEIARQIEELASPQPLESSELYEGAQEDTEFILTTLKDVGVALGDPDAEAALVEEARDYFWVEYRLGPSDPWAGVHPAFKAEGGAPDGLTATEYLADPLAVPEELHHRFRFQAFVEQTVKGELQVHPVMDAWEASTADLVGTPLTYSNYPQAAPEPSDTLDAVLDKTRFFAPMVNDRFAPGASAFDLTGEVHDISRVAGNPNEATFELAEDISGATDRVLGEFGEELTGKDAEALPALTAQWIEFTFVAPGGEETTHRRTIVDRIGAANRQAKRIAPAAGDSPLVAKAALIEHQTLALAAGEYSAAFVLDQSLRRFLVARPSIEYALRLRYFPQETAGPPPGGEDQSSAWAGYLAIFGMFDTGARHAPDGVAYRPVPSLVVYRLGLTRDAGGEPKAVGRSSVDIVSNHRRGLEVSNGHVTLAPERLVWAGAWETHGEAVAAAEDSGSDAFTTMVAFERARAASIPVRVVTSEQDPSAAELALTAEANLYVRRDLANGYVVLVPAGLPPGEVMTGWWRVDPRTGETLGMTSDGRGQALGIPMFQTGVETVILVATVAGAGCAVVAALLANYADITDVGQYVFLTAGSGLLCAFGIVAGGVPTAPTGIFLGTLGYLLGLFFALVTGLLYG